MSGNHHHGHSLSVAQTPGHNQSLIGNNSNNFNSQPTLKSKRTSSRQGTAQSTKNSNMILGGASGLYGGSIANGQASIILKKPGTAAQGSMSVMEGSERSMSLSVM